jgi:DNA adenine methylase
MWYMGGKFRQSKAICEVLRPYITPDTVYVEPFCGGMWSAVRVAKELKPSLMILNDINKPLMLLWKKCLAEGCDWLPVDAEQVEREYPKYRAVQDENDPLTAWYGIALSFGGKWFGGVARHTKGRQETTYEAERKFTYKKIDSLRTVETELYTGHYKDLEIPDNAVVYLDPPYEGRTKAHHFDSFNYNEFWEWVRELSRRCTVFTSCFDCPEDFEVVYNWGDTVVRHHASKGSDGTNEKLVRWKSYE